MRIGVLGGTFDPMHIGHLWMAEAARDQLSLDRVYLIPASRPPHKLGRQTTPYEDRLAMARLSIAGAPGLVVSEIERDPTRPSFTLETLRRLRGIHAGAEFWLVIGGDSLRDLPTWRDPAGIVSLAGLAVLPRPGVEVAGAAPDGARVEVLGGPELSVSSTELRERLRDGRSVRHLVPAAALRWIERHGLYRGEEESGGERGREDRPVDNREQAEPCRRKGADGG